MQLSRRPAKAGLIVAALVAALTAALLTFAQPASAAGSGLHCVRDPFPSGDQQVCLFTDGVIASAEINAPRGNFHSPTIALEMCSVGPSNCGIIASRGDVGHIWPDATHPNFFDTSKPYSPGHIYRAIGSWISGDGFHHVAVSTAYFTQSPRVTGVSNLARSSRPCQLCRRHRRSDALGQVVPTGIVDLDD